MQAGSDGDTLSHQDWSWTSWLLLTAKEKPGTEVAWGRKDNSRQSPLAFISVLIPAGFSTPTVTLVCSQGLP